MTEPRLVDTQPEIDLEKPNIAAGRALLLEAFAKPEELGRFCLDRPDFERLASSFGSGGVDDMVDEVIDFCRTRKQWQALLNEVKKYTPRLYADHEPGLYAPGSPTSPRALRSEGELAILKRVRTRWIEPHLGDDNLTGACRIDVTKEMGSQKHHGSQRLFRDAERERKRLENSRQGGNPWIKHNCWTS